MFGPARLLTRGPLTAPRAIYLRISPMRASPVLILAAVLMLHLCRIEAGGYDLGGGGERQVVSQIVGRQAVTKSTTDGDSRTEGILAVVPSELGSFDDGFCSSGCFIVCLAGGAHALPSQSSSHSPDDKRSSSTGACAAPAPPLHILTLLVCAR